MFIEFTEEQKRVANAMPIVPLLERSGYSVRKAGSQYEWKGAGIAVSILDNLWFDHYNQTGGSTLSFVKKYFGLSYQEAMLYILDGKYNFALHCVNGSPKRTEETSTAAQPLQKQPAEEKEFHLPPRNSNMNRARLYLQDTRGISPSIVSAFADNSLIYEAKDYHNVVFVGFDKFGVARHAQKRSSLDGCGWRANQSGSDGRYAFNWRGRSNRLFLFEAPIDMLSYIDMHPDRWYEDSYVAACSVSDQALLQMLKDKPDIRQIYICFDNDRPGQDAAMNIWHKLTKDGYHAQILVPKLKDWNEDLLHIRAEECEKEGEVPCQVELPFLSS